MWFHMKPSPFELLRKQNAFGTAFFDTNDFPRKQKIPGLPELDKKLLKKKKKWSSLFPALFIHLSEWVSHRLRHALLSTFLPDAAMTKGFSRVWAISYQRRWLNASPVSIDAVSRSVGVEGSPRHGQRIVYFEECNLLVIHSLIGWNCDEL